MSVYLTFKQRREGGIQVFMSIYLTFKQRREGGAKLFRHGGESRRDEPIQFVRP